MIPALIHYCWFGGNPLPADLEECLKSWSRAGDFEVIRWDEDSFDVRSSPFTSSAYDVGAFASVSDYVRAHALLRHGGIYVDTDVEVKQSLEQFRRHRAFSGFERPGLPFTALWGAEKGHPWVQAVLDEYTRDRRMDEPANTGIVSEILVSQFGIDPNHDIYQEGNHGVAIYPSSAFCLDLDQNYATHHFKGSWLVDRPEIEYKNLLSAESSISRARKAGLSDSDVIALMASQMGVSSFGRHVLVLAGRYLRTQAKSVGGRIRRP